MKRKTLSIQAYVGESKNSTRHKYIAAAIKG